MDTLAMFSVAVATAQLVLNQYQTLQSE